MQSIETPVHAVNLTFELQTSTSQPV